MRQVAMGPVLVALLLLAGCEKSFDERYADAEKKAREQAGSIDKELSERASEAAMGEVVTPAPASSPAAPPRRIPRP